MMGMHTQLVMVQAVLERLVLVHVLDVGGQVVQDLEREVAEGLLGALDALAGVGFGEGDAQVLACGFDFGGFLCGGDFGLSGFGKGLEVFDAGLEVGVVDAGLEAELMEEGAGVGDD